MKHFGISGLGMYVPEKVITNEEIESWGIGSSAKWIQENTGVQERRVAGDQQSCSDLAVLAAEDAVRNSGMNPEDIDLIVVSTITPDFLLPQTSSLVKKRINAINSACFDIQAGCAGFVFALISAVSYAQSNDEINNILVIGADVMSKVTDWSDRRSCSITGDGAGAMVLKKTDIHGLKSTYICHSIMEKIESACLPIHYGIKGMENQMIYRFEGRYLYEVLKANVPDIVENILSKTGWTMDDIKMFIFPQVNKRLVEDICHKLNITSDKTHTVMHKYGYTYNSCIPVTAYEALKCNNLKPGDKIIMVGAGAGNFFAGVALEWGT
jgi:3-oxoacyl-[acyl-carrier-protein] synthase-3